MRTEDVYFDETNQVTIANFKGLLTLEEFQSVANRVQELRRQKSPNIQIAILEDLDVLSIEILDWINTVWFPKAIEYGLKYFAFVVPRSQPATMSVKFANKEAERNSPIHIEYFRTLEGAFKWINQYGTSL
ncbi:MAG: hypothetical protein RIA69_19160 [Cyclobacteriaceae bacterium]